jgi:hypothetical protein
MGWWRIAGPDGGIDWSKGREQGGLANAVPSRTKEVELVGGDTPADILGGAVDACRAAWREVWGREPTKRELRAALEFVMGGDELKE